MKLRYCVVLVLCPLLLWSCVSSKAARQSIDPVEALSYSTERAAPVAFAVIPPKFMLSELKEIRSRDDVDVSAPEIKFLSDFFSRADSVFASVMHKGGANTLFFRILAFGNFPAMAVRFIFTPSNGWERREEGEAVWFESSSFAEGITFRATIPFSGVVLAEIHMDQTSGKQNASAESSSMADFVSATLSREDAPPAAGRSGAGAMFFAATDASLAGDSNVPLVFYAPDFNQLTRTVLPAMPSLPFLSEPAISALQGFSLPISSIELAINPMKGAPMSRLTLSAAISNSAFARPASFMLQLIFPEERIFTENGLIKVEKEMPAGTVALAILSLFSVS